MGWRTASRLGASAVAFAAAMVLWPLPAHAQCGAANPCGSLTELGSGVYAADISADGSVVVGLDIATGAFRWTTTSGFNNFGVSFSAASGVNADGSVMVGWKFDSGAGQPRAFRWTEATGFVSLGTFGGSSFANDVNADGSVVVGESRLVDNATARAFRWTEATGMVDLGTLGGTSALARGVNADGSVVVGGSRPAGSTVDHAFRWTAAGGMVDLGTFGGSSFAFGVNADGSVVVGQSSTGSATHAFRWTASTGMVDLGTLGGTFSSANGVSADGTVIVGSSSTGTATHAFRWTAPTGMQDLNTLLAKAGVNMTGITLLGAGATSADGRFTIAISSETLSSFVVFYDDGLAGLSTRAAQQQSINDLVNARFGTMAQQHGLAAPLLGGNTPMGLGNEAGAFASAGSASGGGFVRYNTGNGFAFLGGVAWAREDYPSVDLRDSFIAAAAVQYVHNNQDWWRPFAEAGGWIAPSSRFSFTRTYANGAGTSSATGDTKGDLSYGYVRAGVLLAHTKENQIVLSAELGHEELRTRGYVEPIAANPFDATISGGIDKMHVAKLRVQGSRQLTPSLDATLWAAVARGFNRGSSVMTRVIGFGIMQPTDLGHVTWAEYGARLGYKVTQNATLDLFANGVSGNDGIGHRLHGGAAARMRF